MDSKQLFYKEISDERNTVQYLPVKNVWFCMSCKKLYSVKEIADKCCKCYRCNKPLDKDNPQKRYGYHEDCWWEHKAEREKERFEKAEKVTEWDGPIYCEQLDNYYTEIEDLYNDLECYYDEEEDVPEIKYVYTCKTKTFFCDEMNMIEPICEDMYEDAIQDLQGLKELQEAVRIFNEKNKDLETWYPDYRKVLVL